MPVLSILHRKTSQQFKRLLWQALPLIQTISISVGRADLLLLIFQLVCFPDAKRPYFSSLCSRLLQKEQSILKVSKWIWCIEQVLKYKFEKLSGPKLFHGGHHQPSQWFSLPASSFSPFVMAMHWEACDRTAMVGKAGREWHRRRQRSGAGQITCSWSKGQPSSLCACTSSIILLPAPYLCTCSH